MLLDLSNEDFRGWIVSWLQSLEDETLADIEAVFKLSPGIFPTTLLELWKRELARRGLVAIIPPRADPAPAHHGSDVRLPVGHALDADWRFTPACARLLVHEMTASLPRRATVAHLGAPTTFLYGVLEAGTNQHVLLDRNETMLEALAAVGDAPHRLLRLDLGRADVPAGLHASAAIADPPWYPEDTLLFLVAAAGLCVPDALIMLCQPSLGTRPGVEAERRQLLDELPALGLALEDMRSGALHYQTPQFEATALRAAIEEINRLWYWRRGDLLVLRRTGAIRPPLVVSQLAEEWHEVRFGPVRIKIRNQATGRRDLDSLVTSDVLQSVSRRDSTRTHIGLWTSGNPVYRIAHPRSICAVIELCHTDLMRQAFTIGSVRQHVVDHGLPPDLADKLYSLLSRELREHQESLGGF
jgi:hypothetical protein